MAIEAHITVIHASQAEPALRAWLSRRPMKLTQVVLSHGLAPRQTMITAWREGSIDDAIEDARAIREGLAPLGVRVSRIKLEVAHTVGAGSPALYIEHHVKAHVSNDGVAALGQLGARYGAHLSRNPLRRHDGFEERFLTQRFPVHAERAAATTLVALVEALRAASVIVVKVERERVVYDDNLSLDAGWRPELST